MQMKYMYIVEGVVAPRECLKLHLQMFGMCMDKCECTNKSHVCIYLHYLDHGDVAFPVERRGRELGSSTIFKNLMSPTPRRK